MRYARGGIHHKHCKMLFVETHWTAARWMPFLILGGKFFLSSYVLRAGAFFSVWDCTSSKSLFISSSQIMGDNLFLKNYPNISVSDLYNTLMQGADEPVAKDVLRLCPDLPIHYKSLVTLISVKYVFCILFDYAVSISFRTINWLR